MDTKSMNNNNEKIGTLDFIKIKTRASRNTGVNRSHRMGENNANHTSDKGLIKNTYNSIIKRKTTQFLKKTKYMNGYFSKEDTNGQKHMERC